MAIIFNNETVLKRDFYAWFIQKFVDAGWTDVSSNPTTDFQVLFSTGESGDKAMYINFKENDPEGVFSTSTARMIDIRFPVVYTPDPSPGTSGTYQRSTATWHRCGLIATTAVSIDTPLSVWFHVNKNRGVFLIEGNDGYNNQASFWLFGKPDQELRGETLNSGPILIHTNAYTTVGNNTITTGDDPYLTATAPFTQSVYFNDYPGPLAVQGNKFCSDIVIGDSNGYRYKIDDGILVTDAANIPYTTNYMINGYKYRFFNTNSKISTWLSSFYGYCIGIRIE